MAKPSSKVDSKIEELDRCLQVATDMIDSCDRRIDALKVKRSEYARRYRALLAEKLSLVEAQ